MSQVSVTINWKDRLNQKSSNTFDVEDSASAITLAVNLKNFLNCAVSCLTITEKYTPTELIAINANIMTPAAAPAKYGTVDQKAVCTFIDTTGASHTWEFPAPQAGMFEEIPLVGERITADYGAQIATALSNQLGISLTFQEGWFKSDK